MVQTFGSAPFHPVEKLDQDAPITPECLLPLLNNRPDGITLCVRSSSSRTAKPKRGGYFFHIKKDPDNHNLYSLFDFSKRPVRRVDGSDIMFDVKRLCSFINHCTGSKFDKEFLIISQQEINFLNDPDKLRKK